MAQEHAVRSYLFEWVINSPRCRDRAYLASSHVRTPKWKVAGREKRQKVVLEIADDISPAVTTAPQSESPTIQFRGSLLGITPEKRAMFERTKSLRAHKRNL